MMKKASTAEMPAAEIASPNSSADDVFRNCSRLALLLKLLLEMMLLLLLSLNSMLSVDTPADPLI